MSEGIKLDLGCGQNPKEGFEGVDYRKEANPKHLLNLLEFPWPWEDNSIDEIHSSHFIEHIPMIEKNGKDLLFAFFDECYRILKPDCFMTVLCPNARSNRAFQDPTHRRFIVAEMFFYLNKGWREAQGLSHYNVTCNFNLTVDPIIPMEESLRHPEAQIHRFNHYWNTVLDWNAKLIKVKI